MKKNLLFILMLMFFCPTIFAQNQKTVCSLRLGVNKVGKQIIIKYCVRKTDKKQ